MMTEERRKYLQEYSRQRYKEKREEILADMKDYYKKNKRRISDKNNQYNKDHREHVNKVTRERRQRNSEKENQKYRDYYAKNKERINARRKQLREERKKENGTNT